MQARKADDSSIYQLKVTLRESKPPIWRRIQVRGSTTLAKLHRVLQVVMGWTDSHLHQFIVGDVYYGVPEFSWDLEVKSERRVRLEQIVAAGKDRFGYEYDFGDGWQHEIVVEKVLAAEPNVHYPRCITGKRACPPEDVGGIWGYSDFLDTISNPAHPEHADMLAWVGGTFEPAIFDLETVNGQLRRL